MTNHIVFFIVLVVSITPAARTDKDTGLSTASSKLEYAASKADMNAKFTCTVQHKSLASDLVSDPMTFVIHCKPPFSFKSTWTNTHKCAEV